MSTNPVSKKLVPSIEWARSTHLWKYKLSNAFKKLEPDHSRFYKGLTAVASEYKWPKQPLYEWSRRVEYPFLINKILPDQGLRVLDAGSGVTFLPYHLKNVYSHDVTCLDCDDSYGSIMKSVLCKLDENFEIPYVNGDLSKELDLPSESFDVVYSISAIEHIEPEKRIVAFSELWRLVKTGGRLIVTIDVAMDDQTEGIAFSELEDFLYSLEQVVGILPRLKPSFSRLLTPQKPCYSGLPLITPKNGIMRNTAKRLIYDLKKKPIANFGELACLMFCLPKK